MATYYYPPNKFVRVGVSRDACFDIRRLDEGVLAGRLFFAYRQTFLPAIRVVRLGQSFGKRLSLHVGWLLFTITTGCIESIDPDGEWYIYKY